MDRATRGLAARLSVLSATVEARTRAATGPTWADHPHADLLAEYVAVLVDEHANPDAKHDAAERAGALVTPSGRDGVLQWIAYREDCSGVRDDRFWEAVGGRPEWYPPAPRSQPEPLPQSLPLPTVSSLPVADRQVWAASYPRHQ